ncbi:YoaK family protein [Streptomyces albireticuli]|uniref:YoaK family protein n=1 Tax=Streptomyces albireticuli TaxID=1940 RepID=UPI003698A273
MNRTQGTLHRASDRLFPGGTNQYGALPAVFVLLTVVTGIVDAVSFLGLGHVFVANMTGNVVFLGFALAGAANLSAGSSLVAVGSFMAGAWATGRLGRRLGDPGRLFTTVTAAHAVLTAAALAVALAAGHRPYGVRTALIALLAVGMGMQNAVVRRLAVPDFTTTVLTRAVTGLTADPPGPATVRRLVAVAAMFTGALCGALLQLGPGPGTALVPVVVLLVCLAFATAPGPNGGRGPGPGRSPVQEGAE